MGSVAAALSERGFTVTGSDENVYPPMSTFLEQRNIALFSGYRAENIPAKADVVVIGNAIKRGNPEAEAVLNRKLFYLSLPEVLKITFSRTTQSRCHWHTRENNHHGVADLDHGLREARAELHDRRHSAQFRTGRTIQRL